MFIIFGYILAANTFGYYLQHNWSKAYDRLWRYMPVCTIVTITFGLAIDVFKYGYIVQQLSTELLFMCLILAASGYIFGCTVSYLARQRSGNLVVIAIATGSRTLYITCQILSHSLEEPENDIAKTVPVLSSFLSIMPAFLCVLIYRVRRRSKPEVPVDVSLSGTCVEIEMEAMTMQGQEDGILQSVVEDMSPPSCSNQDDSVGETGT